MDLELVILVGKVAGAIVSIGGAIRYLPKAYRWIRSWTIIKRQELDRLRRDAAKHEHSEAALKSLMEFCAPFLAQKRGELVGEAIGGQSEKGNLRKMDEELADHLRSKVKNQLPNGDQEYMWRGFLWLLKEPFWANCRDLPAGSISDGFLQTAIHGPLCPQCKRDLSPLIRHQRDKCTCSQRFNVSVPEAHDVERFGVFVLRRQAYSEAQAAVRRNELQKIASI